MAKILLITNMEGSVRAFQGAKESAGDVLAAVVLDVAQIGNEEPWNEAWSQRIAATDFVVIHWMGTGLSCDFLQAASKYMLARRIRHQIMVSDGGDDVLEYGVTPENKRLLEDYVQQDGQQNFQNALRFLASAYCGIAVEYASPMKMPWYGIYHPDAADCFRDAASYFAFFGHRAEQPVVAMIFWRSDWLWGNLAYQKAVLREIERQKMTPMMVFTATRGGAENGIPSFPDIIKKVFYQGDRPAIDVLINTFVFSLTTTGGLTVEHLKEMGVVILQAYNLYRDYNWWKESCVGLTGNEVSYAVAMPEFDGVIHAVPVSTQEERDDKTHWRRPMERRIVRLVEKARKWARLKRKKNEEKKVAIVFHNYPPTNSSIGSASQIDSLESVRRLLARMKEDGYRVAEIPADTKVFIDSLTAHATNDRAYLSEALVKQADGKLSAESYQVYFAGLPGRVRRQLIHDWGEPPGEVFRYQGELLIPGMLNGNVYITVQPPRGFGEDPAKIYHSPDCSPTHHYLAFYHWLQEVWQADVMIHVGTHGSLEWLPGKGVAMSDGCYPDICTGNMPNLYPYWITDVGEGIQAKRRSAACLISYLTAPMTTAGAYDEMEDLEKLLEEYIQFTQDDEAGLALLTMEEMIREKVRACHMEEEVPEDEDFRVYVGNLHVFVTDLKNMQMHTGLHILGDPPAGDELLAFLVELTKQENGRTPSLTKTLAAMYGEEYYALLAHSDRIVAGVGLTGGMLLDDIQGKCREVAEKLREGGFQPEAVERVWDLPWTKQLTEELRPAFGEAVRYIVTDIVPRLTLTTLEIDNLMRGLDGAYVEPGPSGAPTSGGVDLLPTGRNFYSIDPQKLPTEAAWKIGQQMGDDVIARFIKEEGRYPESVGIILWATTNLRNHGQCVAEFLYLMGMRPVWDRSSKRVRGVEILPLSELKRPRVDVTGRISGLFRDSLPVSVDWLNEAVKEVAALEEDPEMNFIRKHVMEEAAELEAEGTSAEEAWRQASYRIFGDPPGAHGAGVGNVLDAKNWENVDDLRDVYVRWGGHAYGDGAAGTYFPRLFKKRLSKMEITLQNVDQRESSMLASDDYNSYRGGLVAAVRSERGVMPKNYVSDTSDRQNVKIRSLDEELKRWYRGEAINPKYIAGMKKHGYKGASDLANYVAVSFQWDATSEVMEDWMYKAYAEKYALDKDMQAWMKKVNPWALQRIVGVLLEAEKRRMWQASEDMKAELQALYLSLEGELEAQADQVGGAK